MQHSLCTITTGRTVNRWAKTLRHGLLSGLAAGVFAAHAAQAQGLPPLIDERAPVRAGHTSSIGATSVDALFADLPGLASGASAAPQLPPMPPAPSMAAPGGNAPVMTQDLAAPGLPPMPPAADTSGLPPLPGSGTPPNGIPGDIPGFPPMDIPQAGAPEQLTLPLPPTAEEQIDRSFGLNKPAPVEATVKPASPAKPVAGTRRSRAAHANRYEDRRALDRQRSAVAARAGYPNAEQMRRQPAHQAYHLDPSHLAIQPPSAAAYTPEGRNNAHLPKPMGTAEHSAQFFGAIARGDMNAIRAYLAHYQMNPNLRNEWGDTPVMHAVRYGQLDVLNTLLAYGAPTEGVNVQGMTALHMAVMTGLPQLAEALLRSGAKADALDSRQMTPAMVAGQRGDQQMLQLLGRYQPLEKGWNASRLSKLEPIAEEDIPSSHRALLAAAQEEVQDLTAELPKGLVDSPDHQQLAGMGFTPLPVMKPGAGEESVELASATVDAAPTDRLTLSELVEGPDDPRMQQLSFEPSLPKPSGNSALNIAAGGMAAGGDPTVMAAIQSHYLKRGMVPPQIVLPELVLPKVIASPLAMEPAAPPPQQVAVQAAPPVVAAEAVITVPKAVPPSGIWVAGKKPQQVTDATEQKDEAK